MEKFSINIANDFSDKPGGRWISLGANSGEAFYNDLLLPEFKKAIKEKEKLYIYLDGVKSYPNSFLDQSFGELARNYEVLLVSDTIQFRTKTFNWVIEYINDEIWFRK